MSHNGHHSDVASVVYKGMDDAKARWVHYKTAFMAGLGALVDGYDYAVIAIALLGIIQLFHPSPAEIALLASSAYAGGAVGGIVIGFLADRLGRKPLFIFTLSWFVVMAPVTALSQDVWQLIVLRFLLGFAMGGDFPLTASYVNEMAPVRSRGRLAGFSGACWWPGAAIAMLVGALFYSFMAPETAWRWILAMGALPAVVSLIMRMRLPESTRWLLMKGKVDEALDVVREVNPEVQAADLEAVRESLIRQRLGEASVRLRELFAPAVWRRTLFGAGFFTCYTLSYYAMGAFGGVLLKDLGGVRSLTAIAIGSAIYFTMASVGAMTTVAFVDRVGRRPILIGAFTGMAAVLMLLAVVYPPSFVGGVVLLACFHFFQGAGPGAMWALYIGELFPSRLRASGHGFATMSSRAGAVASSFMFQGAMVAWGLSATFALHGAFAVLGLVLTLWLGIETKNRTLEDISGEAGETSREPARILVPELSAERT